MAFTYRNFLERELEQRRLKNPAYSLRAFARYLEVPAPKLSQIMRGICGISRDHVLRLAKKLKLGAKDQEYFVALVAAEHSRSQLDRDLAKFQVRSIQADGYNELALEKFQIISGWQYFALLELTEVDDFEPSPAWIAKRLRISLKQAKEAVQLLVDHGLLTYDKSGKKLIQTHTDLATPSEIPSQSIRAHHTQILSKAIDALETVDVSERDFSASTFAIDSSKVDEAKKALREFRRKFCSGLQKSDSKDRVYCLSVQLFPLDNKELSHETK